MNKKGFISISSVYAFFLVFLLLLLFIVNSMVSNRILINNIKNEVKNEVSGINKRPIINKIDASGILNSITVTVNASTVEGTITNYYYSIDDGINYVSSTSNIYTFDGLESGKDYTVKVYVKNSLDLLSDVSLINTSTAVYNNPTVTNLSVSSKTNTSITSLEILPFLTTICLKSPLWFSSLYALIPFSNKYLKVSCAIKFAFKF